MIHVVFFFELKINTDLGKSKSDLRETRDGVEFLVEFRNKNEYYSKGRVSHSFFYLSFNE